MSMIDFSALQGAEKWNSSTITYRTDLTTWTYDMTAHTDVTASPSASALATSPDVSRLVEAMNLWKQYITVTFQPNSALPSPNVVFRKADTLLNGGGAVVGEMWPGSISNNLYQNVDVLYRSDQLGPSPGTEEFDTIMHELGHVLGLEDIASGGVLGRRSHTIMADVDSVIPSTPMLYDIAALQAKYPGWINHSYNGTNTVYDSSIITGSSKTWTLWDGGGATDSINLSTRTDAVKLDLRAGADDAGYARFSDVGNEHFAIAFDQDAVSKVVDIEQGYGGSAGDTIIGGYVANLERVMD